jgi:Zn-dependent peptidase ImmA (M78 family)
MAKSISSKVKELLQDNLITEAPVNLEKIAKKLGIVIISKPAEDDLCGFLYRDYENNQTVIGVNKSHHPNRRRFTIAHEIGHFILHNHEGFHFDSENKNYLLKLRKKNSNELNENEEKEANRFAAELLMPKEFIEKDMVDYENSDLLYGDDLPKLARKYQVSVRALTFRLANLHYIQL